MSQPAPLPADVAALDPGAHRLVDGAAFIFDEPDDVPAVWGSSEAPAWAAGEGLMIAGPQGVGKTTLMQQLALGRIGICEHVLGMPIERDERTVLYVAADRPRQAARSMWRMVNVEHAEVLRARLRVWKGPLPFLLSDRDGPRRFREFLLAHDVGTVLIDSLKDVAAKLTEDEGGNRINAALQSAIAEGIETCVGHHQRKASTENRTPDKLADVYGSTFITAGQGSVFLLWGEPGRSAGEAVPPQAAARGARAVRRSPRP
jgi:RecA-family ATPase